MEIQVNRAPTQIITVRSGDCEECEEEERLERAREEDRLAEAQGFSGIGIANLENDRVSLTGQSQATQEIPPIAGETGLPQDRVTLSGATPITGESDLPLDRVTLSGANPATQNPITGEKENEDGATARPVSGDQGFGPELTEEEKRVVEELKARDREVRAHEQAHKAAAGQYATSGPTYSFQTGPDGRRYAVGGEVGIDTSPVPNNPQATITKAQTIRRAALAPAEPSGQDRQVAAAATQLETQARRELAAERQEENQERTEEAEERRESSDNGESQSPEEISNETQAVTRPDAQGSTRRDAPVDSRSSSSPTPRSNPPQNSRTPETGRLLNLFS